VKNQETQTSELGAPWKVVAKCETFAEANSKRNEIRKDPSMQVKVHYMGPSQKPYFAVKSRLDPNSLNARVGRPGRSKKRRKK